MTSFGAALGATLAQPEEEQSDEISRFFEVVPIVEALCVYLWGGPCVVTIGWSFLGCFVVGYSPLWGVLL